MRAILWCNGNLPSESLVGNVKSSLSLIYGVDGGADKASSMGYDVTNVLGDLDSVDHTKWVDKAVLLDDQNRSDLSKSISYVDSLGVKEVDVIGIEGGEYGHLFGIFATLNEAPDGMKIRMHYESGVLHLCSPSNDGFVEFIEEGRKFSVFALTPCMKVNVTGGKWNLVEQQLSMSTRGLNNEGLGDFVNVTSDRPVAIYVERSG